jgi:integrase/recombinase XerC
MKPYQRQMKVYKEGEHLCPVCADPLPAHETWPGARHRFCGKPKCAEVVKDTKYWRYIKAGEHKCEGPECPNFVPEGRYDNKADFFTCCGECWVRRRTKGNRLLTCGCGCGEEFLGRAERKPIGGLYFKSSEHYGKYQRDQYVITMAGRYHERFVEYLEGFAKLHYKEQQTVRKAMGPFFLFLNEKGIWSLEDIDPRTITEFLTWGQETGWRTVTKDISFVSTFFKWAIANGYRKAGNPVVSLLHYKRQPKRAPRPMKQTETELMWQLLEERGSARLRLAAAIANEAGLRIGEISRLRIQDIDLKGRRLFVDTPNKADTPRWAFFSDLTVKYYQEWMRERDSDCEHDNLLLNRRGDPSSHQSLRIEFRQTLCKTFRGKRLHETGFDKWSTHRLRHTMASNLASAGADVNVIMAQGGWKTAEAMAGYTEIDSDLARRGYDEAMRLSREKKKSKSTKKSMNLTEYLDHLKRVG